MWEECDFGFYVREYFENSLMLKTVLFCMAYNIILFGLKINVTISVSTYKRRGINDEG